MLNRHYISDPTPDQLQLAATLLADREPGSKICPSEVARKIAAEASANDKAERRTVMPIVHAVVDQLVDQNISLGRKGGGLSARFGANRIARANGSLLGSLK
jgi:hypothetical protein